MIDCNKIEMLARAVAAIEAEDADRRLHKLYAIALANGGRWDMPEPGADGGDYDPLLKSIEVFGVYAMAEDVDDLPKNWMICARNILEACGVREPVT